MRSQNAVKATAQMHAAGEREIHCSASGVNSNENEQPEILKAACVQEFSRIDHSLAANAAGGISMDFDPELAVIYSGESKHPSDSKLPAKPTDAVVAAEKITPSLVAVAVSTILCV